MGFNSGFKGLSTDISDSEITSFSSAPQFFERGLPFGSFHASPVCPSGKRMLVDEDENGT